MAYNQYQNYPPQQRQAQQGYYNQGPPQGGARQAPAQGYGYADGYQQQGGYDYAYDDYQQGYDQAQAGGNWGYQDQRQRPPAAQRPPPPQQQQPQQQYYDDYGMNGGGQYPQQQRPPPQQQGYGGGPGRGAPPRQQPPPQNRAYPGPNPGSGRGGPSPAPRQMRPQPPQQQQQQGYGYDQDYTDPNQGYQQRNAYQQPQRNDYQQPQRNAYQQPQGNNYQTAPPSQQRPPTRGPASPPSQSQVQHPRPSTSGSQEVKAQAQRKERERILQSPPPMVLSQDNAFPVFPSAKNKERKNRDDLLVEQISAMSLEGNQADSRPSIDRKRSGSKGSQQDRQHGYDGQRGYNQPPMPQRQQSYDDYGYANKQGHPNGQQRGPAPHQADYNNPRQAPARSASARPEMMRDRQGFNIPPPPEVSPLEDSFGPVQRSNTMPIKQAPMEQWAEPGPTAGYHGPESPSFIPPRPPTSSSNRAQPNGQPNLAAQSYSQQEAKQPPPMQQGGFDDVYDTYFDNTHEPNMPNFDAQQPSHKRDKTLHMNTQATGVAPPMPSIPQQYGNMGQKPMANQDFYAQSQSNRSQPNLGNSTPNGNEFVAEMPGDMPTMPPMQGRNMPPSVGLNGGSAGRRPPGPPGGIGDLRGGPGPRRMQSQPGPQDAYDPTGRPIHPGMQRNMTQASQMSDPGPQRPNDMAVGQGYPGQPVAPPAPPASKSPDALPQHPTPVRPGHMDANMGQQARNAAGAPMSKPPPIRQYNSNPSPIDAAASGQRSQNQRMSTGPVTHEEINRLRSMIASNPSDQKTHLLLAKKLVEAASVLADEGGRADTKTRNKNREKYIFEGHKIVKKLVSNGYAEAMFYMADCHGQGLLGLQPDPKEAFSLYQAAAKQGHAASAYRTAVCCEMGSEDGGGTRKDPIKACQWYKRAASLGDTAAMYKMGMILLKGLLGQAKNLGEALNWLKRAAERADAENPHALHELGLLFETQHQGPSNDKIIRDEPYAYSLFVQAADLGYKFSQFRLGQAYEYGILTCPIDARQSIYWYTKAAAQEEHQSELALSGWYLTGSSGILDQSDTEAYLWARKAATSEPPLPKAMFAMGYYTEVGIGCPRSLEEAKRWYGRSAAYKFPKAQERLEELKRGGSKAQKGRERLSRSNQKQNEAECAVM